MRLETAACTFARNLRSTRPRPTGIWHLDEMVVRINGQPMVLWRAVDSEGEVRDMLVQKRRDNAAALRLLRKRLRRQGIRPAAIVMDGLRSYSAAEAAIGLSRRHRPVRLRGNNRAENSHRPIRRWERQMRRFKSPGSAQQVLSIHAAISNAFNIQRHLWSRLTMRLLRDVAHRDWLSAVAAL